MAVTTHKHKGGKTVSYQVRVGKKPAEWFNENNYPSRTLAKAAASERYAKLLAGGRVVEALTCEALSEQLLMDLSKQVKKSTLDQHRQNSKAFVKAFGGRFVTDVSRKEAYRWAKDGASRGSIAWAIQVLNHAIDLELRSGNPFRGLKPKVVGRASHVPPTPEEFDRILAACSALGGDYGPHFRALVQFGGFTGIRPGELFALEWDDIDFEQMLVHVRRRVYKGGVDIPKSNKERTIVLLPQARDALLPLQRVAQTVFVSKRGRRLSQPALSLYWATVKAVAGVDHDFYLATRHRLCHELLVVKRLSENAVVQMMGHRDAKLLAVYGHRDVGWQDEIRAAYGDNVTQLRAVGT